MSTDIDISLTEAEKSETLIRRLCGDIKLHFLELGMLLALNQDRGLWSEHHESFKDFVETLGIGDYSWVTRLVRIGRVVTQQLIQREELMEMGMSKACLLLPRIEKGDLDEDTKILALVCTFSDLREHLGHHLHGGDGDEFLLCPRCGVDITLRPGMVKRR